jgi:hypothetical protein
MRTMNLLLGLRLLLTRCATTTGVTDLASAAPALPPTCPVEHLEGAPAAPVQALAIVECTAMTWRGLEECDQLMAEQACAAGGNLLFGLHTTTGRGARRVATIGRRQ